MPTSPKQPDSLAGSAPQAGATTLVLGRVLGAFGIQGWIRVRPFSDSPDGLLGKARWGLRRDGATAPVQVEETRTHGALVVARLAGVSDRNQAEALRGCDVTIERDQLPAPAAGEYYWSDLIGLSVRNETGILLGRVAGLIEAPAHDVLRVEREPGREQLIPFVEPIVRTVDVGGGWITVDWEADY